jgi:[ribosomal protein S5]-alanine N-acetyltransferase
MRPSDTIETARLILRPPTMDDAPAVFAGYAQDPLVTRYLTWRPHPAIETTRAFLRRCIVAWQDGSAFPWGIIRKDDQQLIGMIEIRIKGHSVDLGYGLARHAWGNGYMPEAVGAIMDWAWEQPQIYRVWAVCDVENPASARVLEKVGMQREGLLRRWIIHPSISDEARDCYCYARTK